ncbi:unnamed protein product, partial [Medioppia subpectinata]
YDVKTEHGAQLSRKEEGDGHGSVRGSYGYRDDKGIERRVDYVADKGGFRAVVKTNEPGTAKKLLSNETSAVPQWAAPQLPPQPQPQPQIQSLDTREVRGLSSNNSTFYRGYAPPGGYNIPPQPYVMNNYGYNGHNYVPNNGYGGNGYGNNGGYGVPGIKPGLTVVDVLAFVIRGPNSLEGKYVYIRIVFKESQIGRKCFGYLDTSNIKVDNVMLLVADLDQEKLVGCFAVPSGCFDTFRAIATTICHGIAFVA